MQTQRLALQISAILATLIMSFQPAWSAAVNPNAARGKKVIYVYNQTKLEKARTAEPTDPKRIAQLESWRKNDEDAMQFLRGLALFKAAALWAVSPPE
jgi:hypothetical protein